MSEKYALALGSGGHKGYVHIGVIKALEKLGIEITHISGSSVGSIVGALYALNKDIKKVEEIALGLDKDEINSIVSSYVNKFSLRGNNDPLLFFIQGLVNDASFSDCEIPFVSVSVDLNTGNKIFHKEGQLKHALRASCSVSYLFGAYEYENKFLIDGGYADAVPVDAVKSIGGDKVIGVCLESYSDQNPDKRSYLNVQSATYKATLYNIAKEDMRKADKKIFFDLGFVSVNDVLEDKKKYIDIGYTQTLKMFDGI